MSVNRGNNAQSSFRINRLSASTSIVDKVEFVGDTAIRSESFSEFALTSGEISMFVLFLFSTRASIMGDSKDKDGMVIVICEQANSYSLLSFIDRLKVKPSNSISQ